MPSYTRGRKESLHTSLKHRSKYTWLGLSIRTRYEQVGAAAPWGIVLSPAVGALLMLPSTVIVALNAQLLCRVVLGPMPG